MNFPLEFSIVHRKTAKQTSEDMEAMTICELAAWRANSQLSRRQQTCDSLFSLFVETISSRHLKHIQETSLDLSFKPVSTVANAAHSSIARRVKRGASCR